MDFIENRPIIIDNGANYLKAGYAGDGAPQVIIPMIVAQDMDNNLVGEHAQDMKSHLVLSNPISNGVVTDIKNLSHIWHYMFMKELRTNPSNHSVLICDPPLVPPLHRKQMAEMVFEHFQMPAMYITSQSVLSLYATGHITGLSFDMGTMQTNIVPVYNTYPIEHAIRRLPIGGFHVTKKFKQMLVQSNPSNQFMTYDWANQLKEQACRIIPNPTLNDPKFDLTQNNINNNNKPSVYYTPDGKRLVLSKENYTAPEFLFNQVHMANGKPLGMQHFIQESIHQCPQEIRSILYSNIVPSGGGCLLDGFVQRMQYELGQIEPNMKDCICLTKPKNQLHAVWIGGSILASLDSFQRICVQKAEYDEYGPNIVNIKCK